SQEISRLPVSLCVIRGKIDRAGLLVQHPRQHFSFEAKPAAEDFAEALTLILDVLISHLLRLRTDYESIFVEEKRVRKPRTLCQQFVKVRFFFLVVCVR